jgi:hypothetical protein
MPRRTIIGLAIVAAMAVSAIAATMALASGAEYLLATGTFPVKFTSFSGKGTLGTRGVLEQIVCRKDRDLGELLSATTFDVTIDFEECAVLGIPFWSLGDPKGTILTTVTGVLGTIPGARGVCAVLTPTGKLHIESEAGVLIIVTGSVIGELTPVGTRSLEGHLVLERKAAGEQKLLECTTSTETVKTHLESTKNEGTPEAAAEVTTDSIGLLSHEATLDE